MDSRFLIYSNDGEFRVARDDLMKHDYFRAMLQHNPPFLTLPFPQEVVRHILGVVQHGPRWTIPLDNNVNLGLEYCQLIQAAIIPAEDPPFPPFSREEMNQMSTESGMEAMNNLTTFQGQPIIIDEEMDSSYDLTDPGIYRTFYIKPGWVMEGQITIRQ